jgi:hypothetical protein
MMSRWYKQMSATGQRTKSDGEILISCKQETPAKLARAEFEWEKITTLSITIELTSQNKAREILSAR